MERTPECRLARTDVGPAATLPPHVGPITSNFRRSRVVDVKVFDSLNDEKGNGREGSRLVCLLLCTTTINSTHHPPSL